MSRSVEWKDEARRDLKRIGPIVATRIVAAVVKYAETGHGDVTRLQGEHRRWRLRVGDYRVIFTLDDPRRLVIVLRVLPRQSAYK